MKALIITGGDCVENVAVPEHDFCIAADSGFFCAERFGVFPDYIIGDFDSVGDALPEEYADPSTGRRSVIIRHPSHKNETDTMLAADFAAEKGASEIHIIGGLGGRADHALSNVFLLERLAKIGIGAILTDGMSELRIMREGTAVHLPYGEYRYFSTLAVERCVVSVSGCAYPLDHSTLVRDEAYAVSNEPLTGGADVVCHEGMLLLVRSEKL